jgi:hypothetical protein
MRHTCADDPCKLKRHANSHRAAAVWQIQHGCSACKVCHQSCCICTHLAVHMVMHVLSKALQLHLLTHSRQVSIWTPAYVP